VSQDVQGDDDGVVVGPEQREEGGMCARDERVCTSVLSALLRSNLLALMTIFELLQKLNSTH
jgi:hypothetical protein